MFGRSTKRCSQKKVCSKHFCKPYKNINYVISYDVALGKNRNILGNQLLITHQLFARIPYNSHSGKYIKR